MKIIALAAAVLALSAPLFAHAQSAPGDQTASVAVRYSDLDLSRPQAAATLLDRVGRASLEACGASDASLPDLKDAVRRSDCYRANMQQAVTAIGSPAVAALYSHSAEMSVGTK